MRLQLPKNDSTPLPVATLFARQRLANLVGSHISLRYASPARADVPERFTVSPGLNLQQSVFGSFRQKRLKFISRK